MLTRSLAVTLPSSGALLVRCVQLYKIYITICHPGTFQHLYRVDNILITKGVMGLLGQVDNIVKDWGRKLYWSHDGRRQASYQSSEACSKVECKQGQMNKTSSQPVETGCMQ